MKKKINKPTGKVRCYACYAPLPLWDSDDPDEVILRHRVTRDCVIAFPKFEGETKQDAKKFNQNESKKKGNWKKKKKYSGKKHEKVAHYKKTGASK